MIVGIFLWSGFFFFLLKLFVLYYCLFSSILFVSNETRKKKLIRKLFESHHSDSIRSQSLWSCLIHHHLSSLMSVDCQSKEFVFFLFITSLGDCDGIRFLIFDQSKSLDSRESNSLFSKFFFRNILLIPSILYRNFIDLKFVIFSILLISLKIFQ